MNPSTGDPTNVNKVFLRADLGPKFQAEFSSVISRIVLGVVSLSAVKEYEVIMCVSVFGRV